MPPKNSDNDDTNIRNPKLILRTYQPGDREAVNAVFTSTSYALVLEGIRAKLWAPMTWILWLFGYTGLMTVVPSTLLGPGPRPESWTEYFLKLFISAAWAAIGFAILFLKTERYDLRDMVEEGRENDLSDPEVYYLNYEINEEGERVRKPASEQLPSHFWVLSVDGQVIGMAGLAMYEERVLSKRKPLGTPMQELCASIYRKYGLSVPRFCQPKMSYRVFAEATGNKLAVLQRLAIENDYQSCGLSTLLINRVMTFANENGIEEVLATTNEMTMAAEQVLIKRHGFKQVEKEKTLMGNYQALLTCNVKKWMEEHGEQTKSYIKKV
ncbi:hypothetical protein BDB00DRAFT_824155 [Zychaea mexicana]|uniref:uncharacterized protein n=1 Tax=Zychaea mexicana TaxID=64656 RepID=UPI0022FF4197|nr:uncharacterized protein BDB00DRAFT_824155 [Zychaea mexicana]KAI9493256.1 hypothetical protein BDB00DRAFT_824155 [Zychaea mexicana]